MKPTQYINESTIFSSLDLRADAELREADASGFIGLVLRGSFRLIPIGGVGIMAFTDGRQLVLMTSVLVAHIKQADDGAGSA